MLYWHIITDVLPMFYVDGAFFLGLMGWPKFYSAMHDYTYLFVVRYGSREEKNQKKKKPKNRDQ
jgi:hypothetical protein